MKGIKKQLTAWLCVLTMVGGLFMNAGPIVKVVAADTTASAETVDDSVREWYVYGDDSADTGLVVTDTTTNEDGTTNAVTSGSIDDAGVELPDGLTESNFNLQVKLTVEGDDTAISTLNGAPDMQFELCNVLRDCGELSWGYRNFVTGTQTLTFAFKDATHTNNTPVNGKVVEDGHTPFDWQDTINWFRFYQTASTSGLKITVNEIKIVYGDHGLTFGADDTYLKLDSAMDSTPKAVEATVNMPSSVTKKGWTLHEGTAFSYIADGYTVGSYTTTAADAPGAGMECFTIDASSGAISGMGIRQSNMGIDASGYDLSELAVAFWVWSNEAGTLGTGEQLRIGSSEYFGSNALIYYYTDIPVSAGWNYIELPLDEWKTDIKQEFTVSSINSVGFSNYNLSAGQVRYFGDMELVVIGETKTSVSWDLRSGSSTTTSSGHTLTTGTTTAADEPGAGMSYSIVDASSSAISGFGTLDNGLGIDATGYELSDLAVAFWVWSNEAGTLGTGDQLRIGSGDYLGSNALIYYYSNISVEAGWNYITLPLDKWETDIKQEFTVSNINCFGFTGYSLAAGQKRYFGDFKLVVLDPATEWQICTGSSIANTSQTVTTGTTTAEDAPGAGVSYFTVDASSSAVSGFGTRNGNLGIDTGDYTIDEVALTFWVWSNEAGTLGTGDQLRIGSNTDNVGSNALIYYYKDIAVEAGWNYIELPLSSWKKDIVGSFSVNNINCFGFTVYNLAQGQIRRFADFKLVAVNKGENWTMCDTSTTYNNDYGLSYAAGSVTGEEVEPEYGTTYAKIEVPAYDASVAESGKFGFELPEMPTLDVSTDPSNYAVGFWFYSSTGLMPNGQFELNSSDGANDSAELHWYPQNWNIQKGWNYVTVNLDSYASDSTPDGVDRSSINYLRWYSDSGAQVTQDTVFAISDIELIKVDTNEVVETLCKAENQPLWYGLSKTVCTMQQGPTVGTEYVETTVPGYTEEAGIAKSCFGFYTPFTAINASAYEASNLVVTMWVYTATGKLPQGQIEINSSGAANDSAELVWFPNNFNSQLQIGWNKLELNLGSPHHTGGSGIDLSNINYIRWYTDESSTATVLQADTTFRVGEIKLYAENVDEGDVVVTQNAKVTSDNYMIFSNANKAKEENPFAVFVTSDGYPSVLCNTTQFTLEKNICTGTDVTLKVVRTNAGTIKFYINGELAGKSATAAETLGAPSKPYSIGADGKGNQVFVGTIKDVKAYSNVTATKCIGNWPLIGDIKYVTETMPDLSDNANDAHFAGSRADDWYTVDAADASANEWSLVYIPEMCQRLQAGRHAMWHKMASWIADNAETENIKYVVGDKTVDTAQANAIDHGFTFFDTTVVSSNLNDVDGGNNTFYRFQAGDGVKWMIISLDSLDVDTSSAYAQELMNQYPGDNVILVMDSYKSALGNLGEQVKLIISGTDEAETSEDLSVMSLPAYNDTEKAYFDGEQEIGLIYMLRFTDNGTKVTLRSYAPMYGKYYDTDIARKYGTQEIALEADIETKATTYTSATGGTEPNDTPDGYKFAGWYQQYEEEVDGKTYSIWDASEEAQTFKTDNSGLNIDASAYEDSDLAIQFWVYANAKGTLTMDSGDQLRISSSTDGLGANFLYWSSQKITVEKGWNFISLPLDTRAEDLGFDKSNIQRLGFSNTGFTLAAGSYRYITDMELVVLEDGVATGKKWTLRSASDTSTRSGQTLTTGVTDGFALPLAEGAAGSNVYAKFVDADILGAKAQVLSGTTDKSNYSNIRFLTSVDSLGYKEMGFDITFNGTKKTGVTAHKYVYENVLVFDGSNDPKPASYRANEVFAPNSKYFKTVTVKNVPNWAFSEDFTIAPYWITLDGTKVYGETADKNIWMGYPTEYEYLPRIVDTTYETEDVVIATIIPTDEKYGYDIDPEGLEPCTEELQRALDDCHNMGGGTVYLPDGLYLLDGSITIPSHVTLRGDWQDPDEVQNADDLAYGTTFLMSPDMKTYKKDGVENAYVNRNDDEIHNSETNADGTPNTDYTPAAFTVLGSAGVVGVTVFYEYYSAWKISDINSDEVQKYPYTFYIPNDANNNMLITLKDITVVNGYRGIGTSYEVNHECLIVDNFKGTFLDCGMALYNASDAGRITGVSISSKYWEDYDGTDASDYVQANAVGLEIGDLEWQQFSDCSVDGYNIGISIVGGYRINFAGSMIDMNITNCTTGLTIAKNNNESWDGIYYPMDYGIDTDGDGLQEKEDYPLDRSLDPRWGMVLARSTISATGNAIENNTVPKLEDYSENLTKYYEKAVQTSALVRLTGSSVNGSIVENIYDGYRRTTWDSTNTYTYNVMGDDDTTDLSSYDSRYDATYAITEEQKSNMWVADLEAYDEANVDVSGVIEDAIADFQAYNSAKGKTGGIFYIPGGTYRLDNPITIPAGIELRGVSAVANREQRQNCEGTLFMCYYGDDSSNTTSDTALITLGGDYSGVNGVRFLYPENIITNVDDTNTKSTYTISASNASNVHVVNTYIAASSYGVNITNCTDFWVEGVYACCYLNTINASDSNGVIRGCLSNPNMIARTNAKGLTSNWPEEAKYDNTTADITTIRNNLMANLKFVTISGSSDDAVLVQDVIAYAVNQLVVNAGATTLVINSNSDALGGDGYQFYVTSGKVTAINALRSAIDESGNSITAALYYTGGIRPTTYNTISSKYTQYASAYEENYEG